MSPGVGSVPTGEPGLFPTPTRLALLGAARSGQLVQIRSGEDRRYWGDGTYSSGVRAKVVELERAGWLWLGEPGEHDVRRWRLTDAGRAVLAESGVPR